MVKHLLYYIFLISLVGCSGSNEKLESESLQSPIAQQDSVYISETPGVQLRVHKDQYNAIVAARAEFFSAVPVDPDSTYYSALNSFNDITFTSETGQDTYYLWYTYFLKSRYDFEDFEVERQKLKDLYRSINKIYSIIAVGGTYFSHNIPRIEAYVEWDIYKYHVIKAQEEVYASNFNEAKEFFILQNQRLTQNLQTSKWWSGKTRSEKEALTHEIEGLFNQVATQIENPFYLYQVVQFQKRYMHIVKEQS